MIKTKPVIQRTLEENKYYWFVVVDMIATHGFNGDAALAHHCIRDHAKKYWGLEIPLPTQF